MSELIRKKIFIQANCQGLPIRDMFERIDRLNRKYCFLDIKPVHLWKNKDEEYIFNKLSEADIFLHQPVSERNFGRFSSDNLYENLKKGASSISFPNVYFTGYHPQAFYLKDKNGKKIDEPFPYHDKNIYKAYREGKDVQSITNIIKDPDFYSKEEIEKNINDSLAQLREKETMTTIVISDYIEKNMFGKRLFHVFNHPSNELIFELFNRILEVLGEDVLTIDEKKIFNREMLSLVEYPIYKAISDYFEIDEFLSIKVKGKLIQLEEMVGEYISVYTRMDMKEIKCTDFKKEKIKNRNVPEHPRLNISDSMVFPQTSIVRYKNVNVKIDFEPEVNPTTGKVEGEKLGKVLCLLTRGGSVYTHWLFDLLPKIYCVEKKLTSLDNFDLIIVNSYHKEYEKYTLGKFAIKERQIALMNNYKGKIFNCEEFVTVTPVRRNYATDDWIIDFIKSTFEPTKPKDYKNSDFIYISRARSTRRKVINEDEVSRLLVQHGFEIIFAEDYNISEMHYIVSNAKVILGPHGAGMANIVFAKAGTDVVELFSQHISPEYYYFCEKLNLSYHALPCKDGKGNFFYESELDYKKDFFEINFSDIYVDLKALKKIIEDIVKENI